MLEKWQQLNEREQKLVLAMSVVILVFVFYSLIWQPLNENIAKSETKLNRQQELLTWVEQQTTRYQQAKGSQRRASQGGSLSSIVNRSANQQRITIARMQPQGSDLQVWIDEIAFDQLVGWLANLNSNNGVMIKAIDLTTADTPGVVKVRRLQLGKA